ncbi:uncharacterized protein LOC143880287 [Tasmannia lanceolata]|uniref:uncharacterized protein LOC143880287 n=1 Tax=Tasmannia lanceolata TaxID=3420 RepID=UPI004064B946
MKFTQSFAMIFVLHLFVWVPEGRAQLSSTSRSLKRSLDTLLQDYAYGAFRRPHTGVLYDAQVPSNFTGIKISVMRLRRGSLQRKGIQSYKEFEIPVGVVVKPYVERLALIYQNLGNWSSTYYALPGYNFLAPVLGLLAYDATNISATNLPELDVNATNGPISIHFTDVRTVPSGLIAKCVWFDLDGLPKFSDLVLSNVCLTFSQGHFSIVVTNTAPVPAPALSPNLGPPSSGGLNPGNVSKNNSTKVWKIAGPVLGGFVALVLLGFVVLWMQRYRQNKKISEMEEQAEVGETLQMTSIGNVRAPVARGTRTPPILENEYVP